MHAADLKSQTDDLAVESTENVDAKDSDANDASSEVGASEISDSKSFPETAALHHQTWKIVPPSRESCSRWYTLKQNLTWTGRAMQSVERIQPLFQLERSLVYDIQFDRCL